MTHRRSKTAKSDWALRAVANHCVAMDYRRLAEHNRSLAEEMLATLEKLGEDRYARIDAREWHRFYQKKLAALNKRKPEKL